MELELLLSDLGKSSRKQGFAGGSPEVRGDSRLHILIVTRTMRLSAVIVTEAALIHISWERDFGILWFTW